MISKIKKTLLICAVLILTAQAGCFHCLERLEYQLRLNDTIPLREQLEPNVARGIGDWDLFFKQKEDAVKMSKKSKISSKNKNESQQDITLCFYLLHALFNSVI